MGAYYDLVQSQQFVQADESGAPSGAASRNRTPRHSNRGSPATARRTAHGAKGHSSLANSVTAAPGDGEAAVTLQSSYREDVV